ncbi:MAG: TetR/AcrR family transcriptional regulator [Burkholderiaceae bacterium]|nr:TetR/AcrR family transcriptional regulator [Burkholderiaceae bacterium]
MESSDLPAGPRRRAPSENRRKRAVKRRGQILAAALQCFTQKGYHETSIIDIGEVAGISPGLIYKYCNDKRDVLFQVILAITESYNQRIPQAIIGVKDPLVKLLCGGMAYYQVIDENISAALLAYRETKLLDKDQIRILKDKELQTNQLLLDCILACEAAGYCVDDLNAELATYWIITTAHMWGLKNWRLRDVVPFDEYMRRTLKMILAGILNPTGRARLPRAIKQALARSRSFGTTSVESVDIGHAAPAARTPRRPSARAKNA